jgi:hypothetical protein
MSSELANRIAKPGPGWKHLGCAVWEHASGVRIHVAGLVGLPSTGHFVYADRWPESQDAYRCIRIAGGSRKRGLMIWALRLLATLTPPEQQ